MKLQLDTLDAFKEASKAAIDAAAEAQRLRFVTPGSAQALVYQAKETEAVDFKTRGVADAASHLVAEAAARGLDLDAMADLYLNAAQTWRVISSRIEALRIAGKQAVDRATSEAGVAAATRIDWDRIVA